MTMSEQINEIATALAKAQGEMGGAVKDSANPFFKSKYADLASVWDACREPLSKHGLAVLQSPQTDGARVLVETLLTHTSGQWIRDTLAATAKDDSPQAVGSVITYLRRYALQSFAGVAPEDDDAEAGQGRGNGQQPVGVVAAVSVPTGYSDWLDDMRSVAGEGTDRLQRGWKDSKIEFRTHLTNTTPEKWDALKAIAAKVTAAKAKEPVSA